MKTTSITDLFEAVQVTVDHLSADETLQGKMNAYGFSADRVQEGNTLLTNARQLHSTKVQRYDASRQLSAQINQDREAALETFKEHAAMARIVFRKEPVTLQELGIDKFKTAGWTWINNAIAFYTKAPNYLDRFQEIGLTEAALQQNKAAVDTLVNLKGQRLKKKGEAENSTYLRDASIKALRAWYGEFRKLARIAFKDTPQELEIFGIVVPTVR